MCACACACACVCVRVVAVVVAGVGVGGGGVGGAVRPSVAYVCVAHVARACVCVRLKFTGQRAPPRHFAMRPTAPPPPPPIPFPPTCCQCGAVLVVLRPERVNRIVAVPVHCVGLGGARVDVIRGCMVRRV